MPEYVRVIGVGDLPPGKGHVTEVNGREIAIFIDISINNGYIWHHAQGSSEASMQDHRSRWERLMRRMERRSVVPNSWMSFGVLLDKSCLALVQTNSSGLSCGAYPGKRWTRSLF